eukprot:432883_1
MTAWYLVLYLALSLMHKIESKSPNVVFIVIDDWGWADVGYRYESDFKLKNIEYLQSIGVDLTNYYVHRVCTPTRSSFMNGRYDWQNGAQQVFTPQTLQHLPFINGQNTKILPQYLKENNFQTYGIGKWHLGYAAYNMTPIQRGFDNYFGYQAAGAQDYYTHFDGKYLDFWDNNVADWSAEGTYSTILYDAKVTEYINDFVNISSTNNETSFFLYAAYQTVHGPLEAPPDVNTSKSKYETCDNITNIERHIYCQKLVSVDDIIGNMINTLKVNNMWNDTVIVVSTDNGGLPFYNNSDGKHNGYGLNLPYRAGKATLFEGGVHGNAFISGGNYKLLPNNLRGKNNTVLCHAIDILPTIIEGISGIKIDNEDKQFITGINIWDSIVDENVKSNRTTLYLELWMNGRNYHQGIIHNGYKYINDTQNYGGGSEGQWTLYYPIPPKPAFGNMSEVNETIWLFDLNDDPYEWNNIATENNDLVNEMQQIVDNALNTMSYMSFQDATKQPDGAADLHNNTYAPWIGSNVIS